MAKKDVANLITIVDDEPKVELIDKPVESIHITASELENPDSFMRFINLMNTTVEEVLSDGSLDDGDIEHLIEIGGPEFGQKFLIDAETNKYAADEFCKRIRQNLPDLTPSNLRFGPEQELDQSILMYLSERWHLPLIIIKLGQNDETGHFTLALNRPEQTEDGNWRVLISDPTRPGERWHDLPNNWQTSNNAGSAVLTNMIAGIDKPYDLTVPGDLQTAANIKLIEAKSQRFQLDAYNCGLYCLFAAAVRMGLKADQLNEFNMFGVLQIEEDTKIIEDNKSISGIEIKTRSEIFK